MMIRFWLRVDNNRFLERVMKIKIAYSIYSYFGMIFVKRIRISNTSKWTIIFFISVLIQLWQKNDFINGEGIVCEHMNWVIVQINLKLQWKVLMLVMILRFKLRHEII